MAVEVCPYLELRFYFNGTGVLVTHVAAKEQNLGQPCDLHDFDVSEFSGLENQTEDLFVGNKLLLAVTAMILRTQDTCDAESCDHPESGAWEGLKGFRELLSHPFTSLSSSFPTVSTHELTKQVNEVNF